jgi:hypothetical protein
MNVQIAKQDLTGLLGYRRYFCVRCPAGNNNAVVDSFRLRHTRFPFGACFPTGHPAFMDVPAYEYQ